MKISVSTASYHPDTQELNDVIEQHFKRYEATERFVRITSPILLQFLPLYERYVSEGYSLIPTMPASSVGSVYCHMLKPDAIQEKDKEEIVLAVTAAYEEQVALNFEAEKHALVGKTMAKNRAKQQEALRIKEEKEMAKLLDFAAKQLGKDAI